VDEVADDVSPSDSAMLLEDDADASSLLLKTEPIVSSPPDAEHAATTRAKELMHQNRGILDKFIILRLLP